MSFAQRDLKFTFSGAPTGSFSASGLRAAASILATEGDLGVTAQVKIWGLSMDQMNRYSTVNPSAIPDELPDANLIIEAGNLGGGLSKAIDGPIWQSYIDLGDAPDSAFVVSMASIADAATTTGPQSQPGSQKAEDLIASICAGTGFTFNNNGASCVLRNQSTYGSALYQISKIASAAGFRWTRNGSTISIWAADGTIDDVIIDVGPNTDPKMVGYPRYYEAGIIVTSLYNPQIQIGRMMNVTSSIPKANGIWQIIEVQHDLTTMIPKGPWFTTAKLAGAA